MRVRDTDQFAQQHYVPSGIIFGILFGIPRRFTQAGAPGRAVSGFQLKLVALP